MQQPVNIDVFQVVASLHLKNNGSREVMTGIRLCSQAKSAVHGKESTYCTNTET